MESFGAKCMSGNVVDTLLSPGNASWHSSKSADGSFCNDLDDHNDKAILVKASCRFITIKHTKTGDMMVSREIITSMWLELVYGKCVFYLSM